MVDEVTSDSDFASHENNPVQSQPTGRATKRATQKKAQVGMKKNPEKRRNKAPKILVKDAQVTRVQPPIHHDSRKAPQDKEGMLSALLGTHVPVITASARSKLWSKQLSGPQSPFIAANCVYTAPKKLPENLERGRSSASIIPDTRAYEQKRPQDHELSVRFRDAAGSRASETIMAYGSTYCSTINKDVSRSVTIFTGISNQSIDWLISRNANQLLAVGGKKHDEEATPLFKFEPTSGDVQIWNICRTATSTTSTLKIVYVHDYGATWQLKWCPAESRDPGLLGWLAGVFGDGAVRLWPVDECSSPESPAIRRIHKPAYEFRVPDTQCVKLDWVSETRIAIACANGMYVIWDFLSDPSLPSAVGHPHSSYINNIVNCAPSAKNTILTSSWDCNITFSDLQQWDNECLSATRERMPVYAIAWSDFLNSAVMNEDLRGVRTVAMRTGNAFSIAAMAGTVTALATHAAHPFLAIGDTSGSVLVVNLCRKALWKKHEQFQRQVYQLDWMRDLNAYDITENYQIGELLSKTEAATAGVTNIYPNELCIKDLAWNGNSGYEALLASCSANFVRIDDLTVTG
ncbi:Transcription factor tau subunit sfc65 / FY16936)) [Taphrina deformans PYCC 5710]|uniref:Transcription factor tau subunit sfc65 / FY16936 n=1 Tax=Taphrina deformans (strain PYCC 5710 / ATCC 11124 / CBS 356.35 / IMI 108563 / JCM 9778 / NBRC 8474) TaxID=1097556 RepID=R4X9W0_TAPDE|nr:Transcription factor tau subunit sfc65 / FY16936)) [Taphrina deformans PYCC 5710]|eukprot:CCG82277.1 Transcription factor tau subunit sfc65 / FY16936)) [Taphrina deformans PYCC 5710]